MDLDTTQLLRIFRAVAGPVAKSNVDKAVAIIRNGGRVAGCFPADEIRTYFRIKERLKEHGLI
jgi:hypothetical protein